jgi:hypothetical protein
MSVVLHIFEVGEDLYGTTDYGYCDGTQGKMLNNRSDVLKFNFQPHWPWLFPDTLSNYTRNAVVHSRDDRITLFDTPHHAFTIFAINAFSSTSPISLIPNKSLSNFLNGIPYSSPPKYIRKTWLKLVF